MLATMDTGLVHMALKQGLISRRVADDLLVRIDNEQVSAAWLLEEEGHLDGERLDALIEDQRQQSIPQVFDGYRVQSLLGKGGMSVVLKAVEEESGRLVALKLLSPRVSRNADMVARFHRELRSAAKVDDAYVIRCYCTGEINGRPYMALEYMPGGDVRALLRQSRGPLPEKRVVTIGAQCARGLVAIHARGLMHRDLKPGNIFLDHLGQARIADLGLAKSQDLEDQLTMVGKCVGTPIYMSPEQIQGVADLDIRTDIYALGATLYHMSTGRLPFNGPTPQAVMRQVVEVEPTPPRSINPQLSSAFAAVLAKAMCKDRTQRYQSPEDLACDLEQVAAGHDLRIAKPSVAIEAVPVTRSSWWRRICISFGWRRSRSRV